MSQRVFRIADRVARWVPPPAIALAALYDIGSSMGYGNHPAVLIGIVLQVLLAFTARRRPFRAALSAVALLGLQTVLLVADDAEVAYYGLQGIHLTENLVGLLVLFHACRQLPLSRAASVVAMLVLGCGIASMLRVAFLGGLGGSVELVTVGFGVLQLVLVIGTALYLRGWLTGADGGPGRALLRTQWPVVAALSVLLFVDFATYVDRTPAFPALLVCTVLMAVLAVVAPRRPLQAALLGAAVPVMTTAVLVVFGGGSDGLLDAPFSTAASGALLIAFLVRNGKRARAAWGIGAIVLAGLVSVVPLTEPGKLIANPFYLSIGMMLLFISVGTGWYLRARDTERARLVSTAVSDAQQAERMALARELHDVVAHHVTGIVVQAQAAQLVAAKNPGAAADALGAISDSGSEALAAMRRLVGSMRGADAGPERATTDLAADLRSLLQNAEQRKSGPHPVFELDVRLPEAIPGEIARSALRVVQEALTNVERHGVEVTSVHIRVRTEEGGLAARIVDDGKPVRSQPLGGTGGYGLVGMRERVELLGGRFEAGRQDAGWCVEVLLPLEGEPDDPGADR